MATPSTKISNIGSENPKNSYFCGSQALEGLTGLELQRRPLIAALTGGDFVYFLYVYTLLYLIIWKSCEPEDDARLDNRTRYSVAWPKNNKKMNCNKEKIINAAQDFKPLETSRQHFIQ